ncbi:hypothetical protein P152DRAFT_495170 [Eremomyces bilateralis CBS 781.70]|uniref:Uncharacterized protein n=1 Tax=Eremomyces bilateralis CBS 781.70 TaxID=1392243 RepID=A0A6G1FTT3_9PEZI|nr:uncharacterized protein P152DRAFT_495170 [Eremomyces bilateralis CBS 781.70]KAF1809207.1 hypothetical protein P152DRAFT_495170 [Eremomyces bilateralis CBS 781.70]
MSCPYLLRLPKPICPGNIHLHLQGNTARLPDGPYKIQLDRISPVAEPQRLPYQSQQREEEQHHEPSLRQVHGKSPPQAASQAPHQHHPLPSQVLAQSPPAPQAALHALDHALLLKIADELKRQHTEGLQSLQDTMYKTREMLAKDIDLSIGRVVTILLNESEQRGSAKRRRTSDEHDSEPTSPLWPSKRLMQDPGAHYGEEQRSQSPVQSSCIVVRSEWLERRTGVAAAERLMVSFGSGLTTHHGHFPIERLNSYKE